MPKFSNAIQFKVAFGFLILTLTIVSLVYFILFNSEQSEKLIDQKSQFHSLSDALSSIQKSNDIYISNAARDYESYYRDLEVYYKVLISDISEIDKRIEKINQAKQTLSELSGNVFNLIENSKIHQLENSIVDAQATWKSFRKELMTQFGDNKEEPRLEWGAKYIAQNANAVAANFNTLIRDFDNISQEQTEFSSSSGKATIAVLLVFFIMFAGFFYVYIIKPLQIANIAFQRVSEGDFGHQIQFNRYDEIGQLIYSFNQMSARSDSVLSILSKLQSIDSLDEVVSILFSQSKNYIGCDLVAIVKHDFANSRYKLNNVAPPKGFKNLCKLKVQVESIAQKKYMQTFHSNRVPVKINSISGHTALHQEAEIAKTLIRHYPLKSAIFQPLEDVDGKQVFLILASYNENKFSPQHIELLNHLIPFINHKMQSINRKRIVTIKENVIEEKKFSLA